ncbi:hypothetical protein R1flu_004371 [Riccia fluitans]|uniref:HTH CENPB-type domain-containing protein n=1 Tax=Riccia fluitans TaxID=41844 RepID=A0ABD1YT56_9MARC
MAPRVQLTNAERAEIGRHYAVGGCSGKEMSIWATKKFGMKVNTMTISLIIWKEEKWLSADLAPHEKRSRKPECENMEKLLYVWFCSMQERSVTLTDELVTDKAKQLYNTIPRDCESTKNFKSFHGWLSGFKKRYNIKSYARHGEAGSVEITQEVLAKIESLKQLISQFDPEDVYNVDETGLFFRLEPRRSLATKKMSGKKASKGRLTIALTCNMTGTDKLVPFVIHKYNRPHAFTKRNIRRADNLGILWHSNTKVWMMIDLFEMFLVKFEKHLRLVGKEKVLLLLDNFSGHKIVSVQSQIRIIRVEFFPPNVTAVYQPMDCGFVLSRLTTGSIL